MAYALSVIFSAVVGAGSHARPFLYPDLSLRMRRSAHVATYSLFCLSFLVGAVREPPETGAEAPAESIQYATT